MEIQKMLVLVAVGLAVSTVENSPVRADGEAQPAPTPGLSEQVLKLQKALEAARRELSPGPASARGQAAEQFLKGQSALEAARKQNAPTAADQQKQLDELRAEVDVLRAQIEVLQAQRRLDALRSQGRLVVPFASGAYNFVVPRRGLRVLPPTQGRDDFVIPPRQGLDNMVRPAPDQKRDDMVLPSPHQKPYNFIVPPSRLREGDIFIRPVPNREQSRADIFGGASGRDKADFLGRAPRGPQPLSPQERLEAYRVFVRSQIQDRSAQLSVGRNLSSVEQQQIRALESQLVRAQTEQQIRDVFDALKSVPTGAWPLQQGAPTAKPLAK